MATREGTVTGQGAQRERHISRAWILAATSAVCLLVGVAWLVEAGSAAPLGWGNPASGKGQTDPSSITCGPDWTIVSSPNTGTRLNSLLGVATLSPGDIWAVGYSSSSATTSQTLVEHWNGSSWSVVSSPNAGEYTNSLQSVSILSANDVWAVGSYSNNTVNHVTMTLVEHWNGSSWSVVSSPSPDTFVGNFLTGVAAISSNNVWAVGYNYRTVSGTNDYVTLAEHWDGSSWSVVGSPNLGNYDNELNAVAAIAANDIWAVGWYSDTNNGPHKTLTEHWNGSAWSVVGSPNVGALTNSLNSVSAVTGSDIWAVGAYNSGSFYQTLTEHWDGSLWSVVGSPDAGSSNNFLNGVVAVASNDVWAAGNYFSSGSSYKTLIEHWDGSAWNTVPSPSPSASFGNYLYGVAATGSTDVWTVGSYENTNSTSQTLSEQYNPCGGPDATPTPSQTPVGGESTPTATTVPGDFNDVPPGSPFYPFVECLTHRNIVSGYPCGGAGEPCPGMYFRPGNNVTRGQAAKIISNAAGYSDEIPPTQQTFADVPPSSPFWLFVERVALHGAISGYGCGGPGEPCPDAYFRPGNSLTRGQLAKIDANVAGYADTIPPTQQTFADVPPSSPFWLYVERVALHSVISGYNCGGPGEPCPGTYYRPGNNVTRGQSAKIISNTFFPDCPTQR